MSLIIDGLCILFLSILVYQDFKLREIGVVFLVVLLVLFFLKSLLVERWLQVVIDFGWNGLFLVSQFLLTTFYFSIRRKRLYNIFDTYIGGGDILLFFIIGGLFSPINFILFYITSILLTLLIFGIFLILSRKNKYHIPLAGSISIQLMICLLLQYSLVPLNFRNDDAVKDIFLQWMN
jgi:hypothetical protein